ncbi:ALIX V-shaped domain binding to HIV-domain-containing protein [Lentinula edodes]|nr:ALIX V-shaped domain binding to HIV-domain-containing protein [Lentinula edodes]
MSNLLAVPFKKAYQVDVAGAARTYLSDNGDTHPDAVKADIKQWQEMRQKIVNLEFPVDMQLEISYAPVFSPSVVPVTMRSLMFERAAVVFNLGSLYSQLAASVDRSNVDGIKRAAAFFQNASGVFSYLQTSILPHFSIPPDQEHPPLDLSQSFVHALEILNLAQAQECFWQKAKLATMYLYKKSLTIILEAEPPIKHIYPSDWLSHIEVKQHHFEAVAQFRRSREELEKSRYGFEIAYLTQAQLAAKKGYDVARKGRVLPAILNDIQSFLEIIKKELFRAERDNDLIYHQDVPTGSTLPAIQQATVAQAVTPKELSDPTVLVPLNQMVFSSLMGWGTREAINIYNDRKKNLIQEELVGPAQESKIAAERLLQSLNLPASLEALERPVGLPPSFLKKAEEVRLENGPAKIEAAIEDLYKLSRQNYKLLNEAMDILDQEASEDESTRENLPIPLTRPPSHEANVHLVDKERRYRTILDQAATGDETIRTKWDQWERNITELTWDEADLEASIPSSTLSTSSYPSSSSSFSTDKHARTLRSLLESLSELYTDRDNLIRRASALAEADDIQPRIVKAAAGFERLGLETAESTGTPYSELAQKHTTHPAMFEDISNSELAKYDKFMQWMRDLEGKQEEILRSIKIENELFLQSRKSSESVKAREQALQSLDLSYYKYKEIMQNLEEGVNFYNDLSAILLQFKDACKQWCNERKHEIHILSRSMQSLSMGEENEQSNDGTEPSRARPLGRPTPTVQGAQPQVQMTPNRNTKKFITDLNSSDWETPNFGGFPGRKV